MAWYSQVSYSCTVAPTSDHNVAGFILKCQGRGRSLPWLYREHYNGQGRVRKDDQNRELHEFRGD